MKTAKATITALGIVLIAHHAQAQGSLTPPGAPAPTMKTLDQVEARTPISSLPFTINDPGSYYVTGDLSGISGQNGIVLNADDVTIDLNGFTLRGVGGSGYGIEASGDHVNLTLRNGTVRDWGIHGVSASGASYSRFSNLQLYNNAQLGLTTAENCLIVDCSSISNGTDGIYVTSGCIVKNNDCRINGSTFFGAGIRVSGADNHIEGNHLSGADRGLWIAGANNYVADNTVLENSENYVIADGNQLNLLLGEIPETIDWPATVKLAGSLTGQSGDSGVVIAADQVTLDLNGHSLLGVPGSLDGIQIKPSTPDHKNIHIRNGTIQKWGGNGIIGADCSNGVLRAVMVVGNGIDGINVNDAWRVIDCEAHQNGKAGIHVEDNCVISGSIATLNGSNGMHVASASIVRDCVIQNNKGHGLHVEHDNYIAHNTLDGNDHHGIYLTNGDNRIDENHVTDSSWRGISASSAGNLVIRNTAAANSTNYYFTSNNAYGPIVNVASAGDISGTANSDHPWANFEF